MIGEAVHMPPASSRWGHSRWPKRLGFDLAADYRALRVEAALSEGEQVGVGHAGNVRATAVDRGHQFLEQDARCPLIALVVGKAWHARGGKCESLGHGSCEAGHLETVVEASRAETGFDPERLCDGFGLDGSLDGKNGRASCREGGCK